MNVQKQPPAVEMPVHFLHGTEFLKAAALNKNYSWLYWGLRYLFFASASVAVITGVVVAVITRDPQNATLIEELGGQLFTSLKLSDLGILLLLAVLICCIDLLMSVGRMVSAELIEVDEKAKAQLEYFKNELMRKDQIILDQEAEARVDLYTNIPNELALHHSMDKRIKPGTVLILLDLVDFGQFNKRYSHAVGTAVLKELAQYMFRTSRRVEHIYRMMENEEDGVRIIREEGWTFRLHRRGDEFLIILEGGEIDALGFLNRLRGEIANENSRIAQAGGQDVLFYAGVFAVEAEFQPSECLHYVDTALAFARKNVDEGRVVWHSRMSSDDLTQRAGEPDGAFEFKRRTLMGFETDPFWKGKGATI